MGDDQDARSLLQRWLGELPLRAFRDAHLGQRPMAQASTASPERARLSWDTLDGLLESPGIDVLVVRDGREVRVRAPRGREPLTRLLEAGIGLVIRRAQQHDPGLAGLARELARDVPGEVQVQLFVTGASSHSFGWHYDAEDVFIVQTQGEKDYYFRRNTIDPDPTLGAQPDFGRIRQETTPVLTCTLLPGDWLYLPRGWWHVAKARSHSLSISLGVAPIG